MDALVDSQIIRSLTQIFKSTPLNKCIKCHKCINENFVFTINNNKIQSSMRCSNTDSIVNFEIDDLYTNENNSNQIPEISENKSIFTSTRELFTFVQDKITNNIFLKNEMINRINKTHYINKRDKENMIAKLMDSFTNNMKINIDCYKILHFLLYNDIQLKEKGYKFQFQDYINISYSFCDTFDLVEKSIYKLTSYYNYQFLIKFGKKHNYSITNSFEFNYPMNVDCQLFNGQFIGRDSEKLYLLSYHPDESELKNKIKEEKSIQADYSYKCIQITSEVLVAFLFENVCFINVEQFVPIKIIDLPYLESHFYKTSNGKIISYKEGVPKIMINKIDEKKFTMKPEIILEIKHSLEVNILEYKENKIIFYDDYSICVYDCQLLQHEFVISDYCQVSSNFKYCLLPDDKLAVANFDNEKLFVFDLHNQKLIVQHTLVKKPLMHDSIEENFIYVKNETLFFIYESGKFIFNYEKQSPEEKVERTDRCFIEDLSRLCDGRILVGYTRYMKLYSFNEKVTIDKIGYTLDADKQIKNYDKRKELGQKVYYPEEIEMEPGEIDYCYIHTFLDSELIIVTLKDNTIFFF